ncbi:MAG: VWA domain-containing protein [Pyrinomonadaceae bacterium]
MSNTGSKLIAIFALLLATYSPSAAQSGRPTPSPTPRSDDQDPVRVFTEEVRLPVIAVNQYGHYDPTLEIDDVLVLEYGVAQQNRSIRHIPASVLVLIDTGNPMALKDMNTTREIANRLVNSLSDGSRLAVVKFSEKPEIVQHWTADKTAVKKVLRTKLNSGKRSVLSDALALAITQFRDTPHGSRHVVLITDGGDSAGRTSFTEATRQLSAVQAVLHVISNGTQSLSEIARRSKVGREGDGVQRDGHPGSNPVANGDPTLPPGTTRTPSFRLLTVNLDRAMQRRLKDHAEAIKAGEQRLKVLAEESGGQVWRSESREDLISQGHLVARDIGAEYVVTYRPRRPLASSRKGEYRRVEVAPRRTGLTLRSRRGYTIASDPNQ